MKKTITFLSRRAAVMLLAMMLTTATAWAQTTITPTTPSQDGDGNYLIVYEAGEKVLDASKVKDDKNSGAQANVSINNGVIEGDYGSMRFTVTKVSQGYAIRTPSGKYVCASGKGSFDLSDYNAYCDIQMTSDGAKIISDNYILMYNTGASFFRFYGSSSSVGGIATLYRAE